MMKTKQNQQDSSFLNTFFNLIQIIFKFKTAKTQNRTVFMCDLIHLNDCILGGKLYKKAKTPFTSVNKTQMILQVTHIFLQIGVDLNKLK